MKPRGKVHAETGLNMDKTIKAVLSSSELNPEFRQFCLEQGYTKYSVDGKTYGLGGTPFVLSPENPVFAYPTIANEFIKTLINKVGLTWVNSAQENNTLSVFKRDTLPFGDTIEEVHVNPAEVGAYDPNAGADAVYGRAIPDVEVAYHSINFQAQYKTTIQEELLSRAFSSYQGFGELLTKITQTLYLRFSIDQYTNTQRILGDAHAKGHIVKHLLDENPTTSEAAAKNMLKAIETYSLGFKRPSTKFNAFLNYDGQSGKTARYNSCPLERQVLVVTDDVLASVGIDVLAFAFNMSKADFSSRVVTVDEFTDADGVAMPHVFAQLVDQYFTSCVDAKTPKMTQAYNPAGLGLTNFYTVFQNNTLSPFANAVSFHTSDPTPPVTP